jgi:hypothetical protein
MNALILVGPGWMTLLARLFFMAAAGLGASVVLVVRLWGSGGGCRRGSMFATVGSWCGGGAASCGSLASGAANIIIY